MCIKRKPSRPAAPYFTSPETVRIQKSIVSSDCGGGSIFHQCSTKVETRQDCGEITRQPSGRYLCENMLNGNH